MRNEKSKWIANDLWVDDVWMVFAVETVLAYWSTRGGGVDDDSVGGWGWQIH